MAETERNEPGILQDIPRLGLDDRLVFQCGPSMDCFNRCCRDVSILLTPYDVLRLKRALGINSSEFLEKHTITMESHDRQIPVVFLRMNSESQSCPFVTAQGCSVYGSRPWACRMYPLGMAEPEAPDWAKRRFYFVVHEEVCHGHGAGNGCSVREFLDSQGVEPYDLMQTSFRRLMSNPGWSNPENLTEQKMSMYFMACYDLDRFRRFVFDTRFLEFFDVDEARVEAMRTDDEELLEFAYAWLAFTLFHEKSMKVKREVMQARVETAEAANLAGPPE